MRWLQSWLRTTADSSGPRCTDGTLLREIPFTAKHCDEQELNKIVENIPGCELESAHNNGNVHNKYELTVHIIGVYLYILNYFSEYRNIK